MLQWFICGNKVTHIKESAQIEILRKYSQDVEGDSQTREVKIYIFFIIIQIMLSQILAFEKKKSSQIQLYFFEESMHSWKNCCA